MQDILDPRFAAQKLAACTLAALRMQVLQPTADSRVADEQLMATWNGARSVIEANMEAAFSRRDNLMRLEQGPFE